MTDGTVEFQDAWAEIIAGSICPRCGEIGSASNFVVTPGTPPAYAGLHCSCGAFVRWLPAPKNLGKRTDTSKARAFWLRHDGGVLICSLCGAKQGDTEHVRITIHHRERVEDNPLREHDLYNTVPLCADCHTIAEALRAHRLHVLGHSARDGQTA